MSKTFEAINANIPEELFAAFPETARMLLENFTTLFRGLRTGTATFAAATTVDVVFATPMPAADYQIGHSVGANRTVWWTNKTVNGFTFNAAASNSDSVDWWVTR